ncbi:hypothetical protein [Nostoc sp.]|uniref:hypothetical protein n=1 Tax=Nostoc sp. TaxID=1180 RepID=UPI002FF9982A
MRAKDPFKTSSKGLPSKKISRWTKIFTVIASKVTPALAIAVSAALVFYRY